MKYFSDLHVDERIIKALEEMGFLEMTEVQAKAIPEALAGKDVIVQSITGSGKTAAFGVPISEKTEHGNGIQAAIICPTRELVNQVSAEMEKFGSNKHLETAMIFGGVSIEPQFHKLKRADIIVGTPGRMLDHMQRGTLNLKSIKILVLDEADRMLDMGFIDDIKRIISQTPENRQTMLFSATMPSEIVYIAKRFMKNPINISGEKYVSKHLLKHYYYDIKQEEKISLLEYLIKRDKPSLVLIFCATRHITDFVANELVRCGIQAKAIHGGMEQGRRLNVLEGFHRGKPRILVATDVAARGLDIKNVSHVFNYDVPKTVEDYTHRIGRTARFGKSGETISLVSREDHESFRKIVRYVDVEKSEKPNDFRSRRVFFRRERSFGRRPGQRFGQKRPGFKRFRKGFQKRRFDR